MCYLRLTGNFDKDVFHGQGVTTFEDGSRFEGNFDNGYRHGHGILVHANGNRYEGGWAKDKFSGQGKWTEVVSGETYEGTLYIMI
jgi:hypothetical protein